MTPPASELVVRPCAREDSGPLMELLRQVWSHKRNIEKHVHNRWWWQMDQPPLYVAEDRAARALVGLCAFIPFTLMTPAGELSGAWFVDFFVLPAFQGRGLGRRLTRAVQDRFPLTASLSQTAMAYRVFQKMGWRERSPVTMFMHPLPRKWMFRMRPNGCRVDVSPLEAAGDAVTDLDGLWSRVQGLYPAIALRTGAQILTRYASHAGRSYALLRCYAQEDCVGYMIVRVVGSLSGDARPPHGLIVDYLVRPDDRAAFGSLLSEAASLLIDRGATRIYCISTVAACRRVLASHGFLSPSTPVLGRRLRGDTKWLTFATAADVPAVDAAAWYLTIGDCDVDYTWVLE